MPKFLVSFHDTNTIIGCGRGISVGNDALFSTPLLSCGGQYTTTMSTCRGRFLSLSRCRPLGGDLSRWWCLSVSSSWWRCFGVVRLVLPVCVLVLFPLLSLYKVCTTGKDCCNSFISISLTEVQICGTSNVASVVVSVVVSVVGHPRWGNDAQFSFFLSANNEEFYSFCSVFLCMCLTPSTSFI